MRKGFDDVGEVILHLAFCDPQQLGELAGREPRPGNQLDDALTQGSFRRQHGPYPRQSWATSQLSTIEG